MTKYVRPRAELESALNEQRHFLRDSSAAYDAGKLWEAKRLASVIYTLVHDHGRSRSLLGYLGLKDSLQYIDTAKQLVRGEYPKVALAFINGEMGRCSFLPYCVNPEPPLWTRSGNFSHWWDGYVFQQLNTPTVLHRVEREGQKLSRKNLVIKMRHQDGGGHVDNVLDSEPYVDFSIHAAVGFEGTDGNGNYAPIPNAHLASMRQIAWELEQTLRSVPGGPQIPAPAPRPPTGPPPPDLSPEVLAYGTRLRMTVRVEEGPIFLVPALPALPTAE